MDEGRANSLVRFLDGSVSTARGLWLANYGRSTWVAVPPALAIGGALVCAWSAALRNAAVAFISGSAISLE